MLSQQSGHNNTRHVPTLTVPVSATLPRVAPPEYWADSNPLLTWNKGRRHLQQRSLEGRHDSVTEKDANCAIGVPARQSTQGFRYCGRYRDARCDRRDAPTLQSVPKLSAMIETIGAELRGDKRAGIAACGSER